MSEYHKIKVSKEIMVERERCAKHACGYCKEYGKPYYIPLLPEEHGPAEHSVTVDTEAGEDTGRIIYFCTATSIWRGNEA